MVRLTDRPDMTLGVNRGRKTTIQQQQQSICVVKFCTMIYDGWLGVLTSFLTVLQSYQDDRMVTVIERYVGSDPGSRHP